MRSDVALRDVSEDDLPIFFEHQRDPEANQMAAFAARDRESFMAHWTKILGNEAVLKQTILFDGQVVGNIVSFEQSSERDVGYWIGKEYWGKGIATRSLRAFLGYEKRRPLYARVAQHNIASMRVLEKCGFAIVGEDSVSSNTSGGQVEEFILMLGGKEGDDRDAQSEAPGPLKRRVMDELTNAFAGRWNVLEATLPNGQPAYTGSISIQRNATVFDLDWDISAGRYVGIGLAVDNHLLVSCGEQRAGLGVALFQTHSGDQVSVSWSTPELGGGVGSGKLTSPFSGSFAGEHEAILFLPDGSLYGQWTLEARKTGSVYEVIWRKGAAVHFKGLGLEIAGGLATGWYPDLRQLAFLDYSMDPGDRNRMSAVWALGGYMALGTELLERM